MKSRILGFIRHIISNSNSNSRCATTHIHKGRKQRLLPTVFDLVPRLKENLSCPVLQDTLHENKGKILMEVNFFKGCWLVGHLLATVL
jgi:hypothetical protein